MSFVGIRHLTKHFSSVPAFSNIDLDVEQGEMCVLVGPSGCGKTTLLRCIAGLTPPTSGEITIAGRNVAALPPRLRGTGMVFQNYALFPNMTVEQNLAFGLEQRKLAREDVRRRVASMIDIVELGHRAGARPDALSGGQKQRVALARALILEPKLLLLDEPMSALDAQIRKRLRDELRDLQRKIGFTAIFVTHDQQEALAIGDKMAIMHGGALVQAGAPQDIYNHPASRVVAEFIGDFNVLDTEKVTRLFGSSGEGAWAIHPEAVRFAHETGETDAVEVDATVVSLQMLGSVLRYRLEAKGVSLKMDQLNRPSGSTFGEIGSKVRVSVARTDIRRLSA